MGALSSWHVHPIPKTATSHEPSKSVDTIRGHYNGVTMSRYGWLNEPNTSRKFWRGLVIAVLDGELTVKRLYRQGDLVQLRPANPRYPIMTINADRELLIWGVVTGSIRQFNR
jgi:hypothetical protein